MQRKELLLPGSILQGWGEGECKAIQEANQGGVIMDRYIYLQIPGEREPLTVHVKLDFEGVIGEALLRG